jgi:2-keto-4-pentenoate hydratase/2-oxohepta-3-ene-1,7-dioic acid hydratase in catechol pathway
LKLLRYGPPGQETPGLLDDDGNIRSLADHVPDIDGQALSDESLSTLRRLDVDDLPLVDENVRLGACVGNVGKFLCIGLNYSDHAAESGMPVPDEPEVFTKATSAICGPNDDIIQPLNSDKLDWEVELAIVIGRHASYVSEEEAADHIAGYCVCNDISERTFQLERGSQWDKGKGCDTFGPIGPWLVTRDEVADAGDLDMWLEVNGHRYQVGNTRTLIFGPAFIVSYLSQFMSLQPGDVISTGTPPGVGLGQKPPVYLAVGDTIKLGIDGLGTQNQTVVAVRK